MTHRDTPVKRPMRNNAGTPRKNITQERVVFEGGVCIVTREPTHRDVTREPTLRDVTREPTHRDVTQEGRWVGGVVGGNNIIKLV